MAPEQAPLEVGYTITVKDLYDVGIKTQAEVTRIGGKVDEHETDLRDHESRLRKLEAVVWKAIGGSVVGGALAGWFVTYISSRP